MEEEEALIEESEIKIESEDFPSQPSASSKEPSEKTIKLETVKKNEIDNKPEVTWNDYLKAENKLKTYYCSECSFETKWKCYLKNHVKKIHSNDENLVFRCCHCSFKTRWKFSLGNHMKVHAEVKALKMYKCPKCDYQTKWNNGLTSHMKVHVLPKVIKFNLYKCEECPFESRNKVDFKEHQVKGHSSEGEVYRCPLCSFVTRHRHGVNKHVKVHNMTKD